MSSLFLSVIVIVWLIRFQALIEQSAAAEADDVAAYLGRYRFAPAGLEATVLVQQGRLAVDVTGQMIFVLTRSDDEGVWAARATDQITVTFETGDDGTAASMTIRKTGPPSSCPTRPSPSSAPPRPSPLPRSPASSSTCRRTSSNRVPPDLIQQ